MNIIKGWRTLALNVVAALPILWDVAVQVMQMPELAQIIPPQYLPYYTGALAFINIFMRIITTTPVGRAR